MKERAHSFKYSDGGANGTQIIFCKYCGHIAFYGEFEETGKERNIEAQVRAKAPCPLTPSFTFNTRDFLSQREIENTIKKKVDSGSN